VPDTCSVMQPGISASRAGALVLRMP